MNVKIEKLKKGDKVNENWKTINDCVDAIKLIQGELGQLKSAVAELRRKVEEIGGRSVSGDARWR